MKKTQEIQQWRYNNKVEIRREECVAWEESVYALETFSIPNEILIRKLQSMNCMARYK